jgi:hypothetical protein
MLQFDAPESKAAETLGVSPETLKTWRLGGKIPSHVYAKFGYKTLRYCLPLLKDWQLNPDDIAAQQRAIEQLNATLPSQLPKKSGRKAA